ncbi:MAG: hypothetical protein HZB26_03010 [Candidatus Hydrogenedentes bacterium]|nr:hypothetical protein [Candidatus Hydrogenedentota bacterium]
MPSIRFTLLLAVTSTLAFAATAHAETAPAPPKVEVQAEEDVYTFVPPNNGSGPLWSYGCTPITRLGDTVVVSQQETGKDVPLLTNTRWRLLRRESGAWKLWAEAEGYRQREPAVVATLSKDALYLYVNDSQTPPGTKYGECKPYLLRFTLADKDTKGTPLYPKWDGPTTFTDHSYRGYSADAAAKQLVMFNIDAKTSVQHWSLLNETGETLGNGTLTYPIRSCYSQVQLTKGACHVLAISDIVEPVEEWKKYKFDQTKATWDYVFRILYYTSTPDLRSKPFAAPIEVANVDKTAGHISNQDLWVAPDGTAYILYTETETASALMRDKFFPGKSLVPSMKLAVVKDGAVISRKTLVEGSAERVASHARFHLTPEGVLYALTFFSGKENYNALLQIHPESAAEPIRVPFKTPFNSFCLATVREGNSPSRTIDVIGHQGKADTIAYGEIAIK